MRSVEMRALATAADDGDMPPWVCSTGVPQGIVSDWFDVELLDGSVHRSIRGVYLSWDMSEPNRIVRWRPACKQVDSKG